MRTDSGETRQLNWSFGNSGLLCKPNGPKDVKLPGAFKLFIKLSKVDHKSFSDSIPYACPQEEVIQYADSAPTIRPYVYRFQNLQIESVKMIGNGG